MRPRADFLASIFLVFACATVVADELRLTLADVRRAADNAARQQGYDLTSYTRGEPSYDPVSNTWYINYRLKSGNPHASGEGILSVRINDTTGFTSTRFWLASPTPAVQTSPVRDYGTIYIIALGIADGMILFLLLWKRRPKPVITLKA